MSSDALLKQLELARRELLELSTRNRLLHTPRDQPRGVSLEIKDESAEQVFQWLVTEGKAMRFEQGEEIALDPAESPAAAASPAGKEGDAAAAPKKTKRVTTKRAATSRAKKKAAGEESDADAEAVSANLPEEDSAAAAESAASPAKNASPGQDADAASGADEPGAAAAPSPAKKKTAAAAAKPADPNRQLDDVLHTELEPEELDRRLLGLVVDAAASYQEQGVNILYLVLGFLRWFEEEKPDTPRDAPLLLIPVTLQRTHAGNRFCLKYTGEDIETNLTLKTRLKVDHGIDLPVVPDFEELSPTLYFQEVAKAVSGRRGWQVLPNDMVLWFFSFTKLLMYRDLAPETWPEHSRLETRPLPRALLVDGFPAAAPLCGETDRIDGVLDPNTTAHVIDCDSSQALVIEEACRGRNLVIQGPPGTGKSQTITNLVASLVRAGKTILFVAEKMAALEVVKRRLDNIGLGEMCLELHSEMASKRAVLQEMERVLKLGAPIEPPELAEVTRQTTALRDQLNGHVDLMHAPLTPHGLTPYRVLAELIDLRAAKTPLPDFQIADAPGWSAAEHAERLKQAQEYCQALRGLGDPAAHPWRGCKLKQVLPLDLERLLTSVPQAAAALDELTRAVGALGQRLGGQTPASLDDVARLTRTARAVLAAPKIDAQALQGAAWEDHRAAVRQLADAGRAIAAAQHKLAGKVKDSAWDADVAEARDAYARHGQSWFRMFRSSYRKARATLRGALTGGQPGAFDQRLEILDLLLGRQRGKKTVAEADALGAKAFGRLWLGAQTDWSQIDAWEKWDAELAASEPAPRFRGLPGLIDDPAAIKRQVEEVDALLAKFVDKFAALCVALDLDLPVAFAKPGPAGHQASAPGGKAGAPGDKSPAPPPTAADAAARSPAGATTGSPPGAKSGGALGQGAYAQAAEKARQEAKTPEVLRKIAPAHHAGLLELRERLEAWKTQPERLQQWRGYVDSRGGVEKIAQGAFLTRLDSGELAADAAPAVFRFAYFEALLRDILQRLPALATFDGGRHQRLIADFSARDQQRLTLTRPEVAATQFAGIGRPRGPGMGEAVGLLRHEMQKKRRHLPLRVLLNRAGKAIQAVKPVFMMSPLSVAQFLEPGALDFDVLIIDEASQVRPVEALGAAARCRQMVVVGDDKQMPPTQFFGVAVGEIDEDDAPEMQAGDVESVLSLCVARNMPQRMLRWHYRSKHQSLIAVSNREFYDEQLYVIPSPEREGELGVKWRFIENGRFSDGVNKIEAEVVAQAIVEHAKQHPNWTLGVAAFSVTQRDAILKELEKLRRGDRATDAFFDPNAPDPFFVKNLENVQGDERDVIFVSVGYGPGENGKVALNFGPVSAAGGERRLNVLMTRAKRQCVLFSSMRPEDIDLSRATGRGPAAFRAYLEFAEKGGKAPGAASSRSEDALVKVLARELTARGFTVETNVGVAGLFVDLAIVDADQPGRYLLGVEVDGDSYRAGRSARDRDRVREAVLTGQGWNLHRVWAMDWFQRPEEQLKKLVAAIDAAKRPAKDKPAQGKPGGAAAGDKFELPRRAPTGDPLGVHLGGPAQAPPPPADDKPAASGGGAGEADSTAAILSSVVKVVAAGLSGTKDDAINTALKELGLKDETQKTKGKSKK